MKVKIERFAFAVATAASAETAGAQGLSRARTVLQNFQAEVMLIIPIIAVLSLVVLGVLWGLRVIRFHTLAQWGGGIIVVGCASQVVAMLLS